MGGGGQRKQQVHTWLLCFLMVATLCTQFRHPQACHGRPQVRESVTA